MQRVLILMSNTGDGHRASAEALQAGFQRWFPDQIHVDVIDIAEYLPWPLSSIPNSYAPMTNHTSFLYRGLWHVTASRPVVEALAKPGAWAARDSLVRTFDAYAPDCVISVHPMLQHVTLDALAHMDRRIGFVTVVTDLVTAHPAWFHPDTDFCFVASAETERRAHKWGVPAERICRHGLPIGLSYAEIPCKQTDVRRQLGLHPAQPTVLIAGGGEGFGQIYAMADHLARGFAATDRCGQLIIICGRNQGLAERLRARDWPIPVTVRGYVKNMPLWMFASDCLITKAGPGAIAEALACGLPLILSGYIPGQEAGNIDYVVSNGAGIYEPDPAKAAAVVQRWLGDDCAERERLSQNARKLAQPKATRHIVEGIVAHLAGKNQRSVPLPTLGRMDG